MTEFHALDLSGDRAALHRWDGRGWQTVAAAPADDGMDARALADLMAPVAGLPVAVILPPGRVAASDMDTDTATDAVTPTDCRVDWVALERGFRRLTLPHDALAEIETFLRALGVAPGGCMADAGTGLPPAWFGTRDSPAPDGRALDRPAFLGAPGPAPETRIAVARRRAEIAARRDPAHLTPLADDGIDPMPAPPGLLARFVHVTARRIARPRRSVAAALVLLAVMAAAFAAMQGGTPAGLSDRTPDLVALGHPPSAMPTPDRPRAPPAAPVRAGAPSLGQETVGHDRIAPRPARQTSLSAMDAPPGMLPAANFYTPPPGLTETAPPRAVTLVIPGLDPVFRTDALALAALAAPEAAPPASRTITAPPPRDEVYVVDARGLILPSPEGRLSPDGFTVVAGAPPVAARPRPERDPEDDTAVVVLRRAELDADDPLRRLLPRARPDGLAEARERDRFGGRTASELAGFVPARRPESAQERAGTTVVTAAVAAGPRPVPRDAAVIARARAAAQRPAGPAIADADVARVVATTPSTTADRATARVGINLSEINLLGTFGAASNRRALVRLPSGRVVNLSVGDRVDGGRVQEIGDGRLGYVKSGQTVTLRMPRG
jgi:hypothetical protein